MPRKRETTTVTQDYEQAAREQGFGAVCGVDEAGRGPLAGPVVAAAVILPEDCDRRLKRLQKADREAPRSALRRDLRKGAGLCHCLGRSYGHRRDQYFTGHLSGHDAGDCRSFPPGRLCPHRRQPSPRLDIPCQCIVGGDAKSASIAAASILAKVTRDRYMVEMDAKYPVYGFAGHKGYGTKAHTEAILAHGSSPIHRMTFF